MSTCISRHGEFGSHETGKDFICRLCFALDDDGLIDALRRAEARLSAARAVLTDRERELLDIKGPCSAPGCRLHHAHSGPCNITPTQEAPR